MAFPIAAAISAVVSLLGSIFGSKRSASAGLEQVRLQNEGNMKLAQYQYEKNLEQWQRENNYNTPKSQMQRLADAGLNPMLMYSQGSTGQAASSPQYEAPKLSAYTGFNYGDFGASSAVAALQRGQQLEQMESLREAQEHLAESQTEYNRQRTLSEAMNRLYTQAKEAGQVIKNGLLNRYGEEQVIASLSKSFQNVRTMQSQESNYLAQAELNTRRAELTVTQREHEELKKILTGVNTTKAAVATQVLNEQIPLLREKVRQVQEQSQLTREQAIHEVLKQNGTLLKNQLSKYVNDNWTTLQLANWISRVL